MRNYVAQIAKMFNVEIGERFYLCYSDLRCCVGEYFFDKDDVLVRVASKGFGYNNADDFEKIMTGYYVVCKWDDEAGYVAAGGAC